LNARLIGQLRPFVADNRYGDVWGEGRYAYLASFNGVGVMIIDISDPRAPTLAGYYNPPFGGRFQDIVVAGGIGYFSSESNGGVHIVDVRDPQNPVLLSQITPAQNGYPFVHELFVADGVLYEADSRTPRVKVFDVRNPEAPVFIRDINTTDPRFIHNITVVNGRLYTSGWGGKTDIYDVRTILTEPPVLLGSVDSGLNSHSSWVSSDGKLLASARETAMGDVRLFDISRPAEPVLLSTITSDSLGIDTFSAHNPYIVGNLLFVAWYQAGTVVIDITDPRKPQMVGLYDTFPGAVNGFDGNWGVYPFLGLDRVLMSDLDGGLFIVDFSDAAPGPRTVSAASYSTTAIAEKARVALFGSGLSTATLVATDVYPQTTLADTTVKVLDARGTERLAPLFYVSPAQINYQIPAGTAEGPATVTVNNAERVSVGLTIVAPAAPSLFTLDQSGAGAALAFDALTGSGAPFSPARAGGQPNIIAIWGTGLGGDVTDIDGDVSKSVQAFIDGKPLLVDYAGRAPGFPGVNQFNLILPQLITPGIYTVIVVRGGRESNKVTIEIGP
jgi:uncharacterized protein (TIGR03437 family)